MADAASLSFIEPLVLPAKSELAETCNIFIYEGYSIPSFGCKFLSDRASSYDCRKDDVYLISYPKTGTTWAQKLVYCVNHPDSMEECGQHLGTLFPFLEHPRTPPDLVTNMPSPRFIKSHLPLSLLPKAIKEQHCKIVYITRNPKDVCVSYYHFACNVPETKYQGTFAQFFDRFLESRPTYSPFWKHTLEAWDRRNDDNFHLMFYEDLHRDLLNEVKRLCTFFNVSLGEEKMEKIMKLCAFQQMKEEDHNGIPNFFRKGQIGDWKNYFTPEMDQRMNAWIDKHFTGSGIEFTYEI